MAFAVTIGGDLLSVPFTWANVIAIPHRVAGEVASRAIRIPMRQLAACQSLDDPLDDAWIGLQVAAANCRPALYHLSQPFYNLVSFFFAW